MRVKWDGDGDGDGIGRTVYVPADRFKMQQRQRFCGGAVATDQHHFAFAVNCKKQQRQRKCKIEDQQQAVRCKMQNCNGKFGDRRSA